jgi:hypothetical protein
MRTVYHLSCIHKVMGFTAPSFAVGGVALSQNSCMSVNDL